MRSLAKKQNLLILLPLFIGSLTLFTGLGSLYHNLISDERTFLLAADLLKGYPYYPYLIWTHGLGTTHTLLIYLMQIPLNLFGYNLFALRLIPALYGLAGIGLMYFLIKKSSESSRLALICSTLLALNHWYLAVSRVAVEISEVLFFLLLNLYLMVSFLSSKGRSQGFYLFGLGLAFGGLQHTYQSARIYYLFIALFFLVFWIRRRIGFRKIIKQSALFLLGFFIALSPLIYVSLTHPESFDSRKTELVFYQNLSPSELIWSLKQSTFNTLGMFHLRGYDVSCYNIPNTPMLDVVSGILMIVGLYYFLRRSGNLMKFVFISFFSISLLPSVFSYWPATPHGLRAAGAIIPTIYWVGIGLDNLSRILKSKAWIIVLLGMVLIGFLNLRKYFVDQAAIQPDCFRYDINKYGDYKKEFLDITQGVPFIR